MIAQLFDSFYETAKAQNSNKVEFMQKCNPIIALKVSGDDTNLYMTTNFKRINGKFLVRKPTKKDMFKVEYFHKARTNKTSPTLFDVAS